MKIQDGVAMTGKRGPWSVTERRIFEAYLSKTIISIKTATTIDIAKGIYYQAQQRLIRLHRNLAIPSKKYGDYGIRLLSAMIERENR